MINMETIIISGEKSKVNLLQELARQLGLSEQTIKKPMSEDQALGILADAVKQERQSVRKMY